MLALGGRGVPENAGIAADLWQDSSSTVAVALHSPFVKGLADGSLPKYAVTQLCLTCTPALAQSCRQHTDSSACHMNLEVLRAAGNIPTALLVT